LNFYLTFTFIIIIIIIIGGGGGGSRPVSSLIFIHLFSYAWFCLVMLKVKVKKVNFTLEQATMAQRGSRNIAVLFPKP
jgi:hypothetical protein